ncbi:MAG: adenylate/guanylate cyclase domain-containing protein [bacterium]
MAERKVEILEDIKATLCKFVPATVTKVMEISPTASLPESKEQDVSVLFIDIQGYSLLSEKLDGAGLNAIVELYFSVFIEAIYANNGDVNETTGDGLMVIFHNEDRKANALEAVRTTLMIRERIAQIACRPEIVGTLVVNIGINSGTAFLGISTFKSLTGCRCTYTARGTVTNVTARISAFASGGAILVLKSTVDRLHEYFTFDSLGKLALKNVSPEVEIFSVASCSPPFSH